MPSDATSILRIDTATNEVTTFGQVETKNAAGDVLFSEKNKWQVRRYNLTMLLTLLFSSKKERLH